MAAFAGDELRVSVEGTPEQVFGQVASGSFFDLLGVRPVLGRLLTAQDEQLAPAVAVIGYHYWQRRFGGAADAVGKTITFRNRGYTIVGVTPPEFWGLQPGRRLDLTLPIALEGQLLRDAGAWWFDAVARLQPGVSRAQATASADVVFQAFMQDLPQYKELRRTHFDRVEVSPAAQGLDRLRTRFSTPLHALMVVALAVLLIGCGNLGTLLLVRGEARAREMAIRQATGASAGRLLRQLLTETVLIFVLGAAAGLLVAYVAVEALIGFFAIGRNPIVVAAHIDWRTTAFAAALALAAALLTGLWPALRAQRVDPHDAMKNGDTRLGGVARSRAAARVLIVGQVALCLALLVAALLFATTMRNLRRVDLGFASQRVLTQSLDAMLSGDGAAAARAQMWTRVLEEVRTLPGVRAASLSVLSPLSGRDTGKILDNPELQDRPQLDRIVHVNHVSEDYLQVFDIPIVQGRAFTASDRTQRVVLVNQTTEAAYFRGRSAVGGTLDFGKAGRYQVVGVVRNAKHMNLREAGVRMVYVPLWQPIEALSRITLAVATQQAAASVAGDVARRVRAVHANTLVSDVIDVREQIDATLISERLLAALGTAFAALALMLAAIGVYGVLSYSVAQRRGEIALRLALGALPRRVGWEIWREVQGQLLIGVAIGLPAAWATARIVTRLLFGVAPLDPGTYALAVAIIVLIAAAAALLPMLRAASLNPSEVVRQG